MKRAIFVISFMLLAFRLTDEWFAEPVQREVTIECAIGSGEHEPIWQARSWSRVQELWTWPGSYHDKVFGESLHWIVWWKGHPKNQYAIVSWDEIEVGRSITLTFYTGRWSGHVYKVTR